MTLVLAGADDDSLLLWALGADRRTEVGLVNIGWFFYLAAAGGGATTIWWVVAVARLSLPRAHRMHPDLAIRPWQKCGGKWQFHINFTTTHTTFPGAVH
jgi:hypothetical protein